jgi:hypothetical protein
MHGAELTRNHSYRDVRGAGVVLNPCMGGHRIVCVCMYVRHAQKIAKLFFSVRSTQFPFKLNILFKKNIATSWAPKYFVYMLGYAYLRNFIAVLVPGIGRTLWMLQLSCVRFINKKKKIHQENSLFAPFIN